MHRNARTDDCVDEAKAFAGFSKLEQSGNALPVEQASEGIAKNIRKAKVCVKDNERCRFGDVVVEEAVWGLAKFFL